MRMSVAALFVIAQNQKLPGCPSAVQWINELWHIHAIKAPMRMNNLQHMHQYEDSHKHFIE